MKELVKFLRQLIKFIRELLGKEKSMPESKSKPKPKPAPKPKLQPPAKRMLVPGGKWFRYSDTGKYVYMAFQSDPEDWIYRVPESRNLILDHSIKFGGNALCLYSIMTHGGDAKWQDRKDMNPFIGFEPKNGVNHTVLEEWYRIAQRMDNHEKILIFNWKDDEVNIYDDSKMMGQMEKDYMSVVIEKFKGLTHLVWMVAEEYQEIMSPAYAIQVARFIKDRDPYHPVVIHQLNGTSFDFADSVYKGKQLFDSFFMQCKEIKGRKDLRNRIRKAVEQARGRYNVCAFELTNSGGLRWGHGREAMAGAQICADEEAYFGWYDRGENTFTAEELEFLKYLQEQMERKING